MDRIKNNTYRKMIALYSKGCKCYSCNKSFIDLKEAHFHHVDATTKLYNMADIWNYSDSKVNEELDKYEVLCKNCHIELHKFVGKQPATLLDLMLFDLDRL